MWVSQIWVVMSPDDCWPRHHRSLSHSLLVGLSCLLSLLVLSLASVTRSRLGNGETFGCGLLTKPEDTAEEQINEDEFIYISKKCDNTMMWEFWRINVILPYKLIIIMHFFLGLYANSKHNKRFEKSFYSNSHLKTEWECNCNKTWTLNEIKIWIWIEAFFGHCDYFITSTRKYIFLGFITTSLRSRQMQEGLSTEEN